jgi:hypothetical protein
MHATYVFAETSHAASSAVDAISTLDDSSSDNYGCHCIALKVEKVEYAIASRTVSSLVVD